MRTIQINNNKIKKGLQEKTKISARIIKIGEESKKLEEEYNQLLQKITRIDEKVRPEIKRQNQTIEKSEFEELSRAFIEKDEVYLEVADRLEEFKINYKKAQDATNTK